MPIPPQQEPRLSLQFALHYRPWNRRLPGQRNQSELEVRRNDALQKQAHRRVLEKIYEYETGGVRERTQSRCVSRSRVLYIYIQKIPPESDGRANISEI